MAHTKELEAVASVGIREEIIRQFEVIVGKENLILEEEGRNEYSHDKTEDYSFMPDVVLKPRTPQEISAILKICNTHKLPATPRGAGTGLSGGALPVKKGVIISMERFNKILQIDELNLQATVEPGVITEVFQNAVKEKGLFYPPDPASKGSCFLGGNLANNSGGPKAVKYGVTRDYVINMEVVLPTGEIIWTAAMGEELFAADTPEEAWALATTAHPEDNGSFIRYIPPEKVARIYAHQR